MKLKAWLGTVLFASLFLVSATASPTPRATAPYDPWCDYNDDGIIDIFDIVNIASRYRTTGSPLNKSLFQQSLRFREVEEQTLTVPAVAIATPWINCSEAWTWTPAHTENAVLYAYWWLEYECNITDAPWETYFTICLSVNGQTKEHTVWNTGFPNNTTAVIESSGFLPNQPFYEFQFGVRGYSAQVPFEVTIRDLRLVVGIVDGF